MIHRDEITKTVYQIIGHDLLEKALQKDQVANGVQIEGKSEVTKIALGVTHNQAFLQKAIESGAEYCIFHHGLDPRTYLSRLPKYLQGQLKMIFDHDLTIAGFHYSLDAHPEIGNNAQIISQLGAVIKEPIYEEWGYVGEFDQSQDLNTLKERCQKLFNHDIIAFVANNKPVKRIGVVSGAAKPYSEHLDEFLAKNIDLYISGETSEGTPDRLTESGINYFVCGHYATETLGVKALGEKLKSHYGDKLEIEFIDIPNQL